MMGLEREERPAYVRFERRPVEDIAATLAAGMTVCKDVEFALVTPPYSKDCVEYKVSTWLTNMEYNLRNRRIPPDWAKQWKAQYEAWKEGNDAPVTGTDVRNWCAISPAQVKNLISAGCRTVEDLAQANDEALRILGMGGVELRKKATTYLQAAKDHGPIVMQNAQLERENAQLKATIETLKVRLNRASVENHEEYIDPSEPEEIMADDILPEDSPLETARTLYFEKFGKKPHHMSKLETIMAEL